MLRINNIFYSLQGEGRNTGRAATFVRFAGCNLSCPFCDTAFDTYREMTPEDVVAAISRHPARFVVLTGGEPTLQADETFVELLHRHGFEVAMESNGTRQAPANVDWLTVSPKGHVAVTRCDEVKVVVDEQTDPASVAAPSAPLRYLQPCDTGNPERNAAIVKRCVDYIKEHPEWRLSLQTHKLAGFE